MAEMVREYLPDPERAINKSAVFVEVECTGEITGWSSAVRFVINKGPRPLKLRSPLRAPELTVIVEASANPRVVFGRTRTNATNSEDLREISRILKAHGLDTEPPEESDG